MIVLILPTGPIVEELGQMNPLFDFFTGGLKEVIFEAILHSSQHRTLQYDTTRYGALNHRPYIVDHVMRAYASTIEDHGRDAFGGQLTIEEYISTMGQLEFLTEWLDDAVRALIKQSLGLDHYEVDDRFKLWLGDDIIVRVDERVDRDQ